ncbi:MAG: TIGR00268 family protein [Methanocalculaceae archaeon]|jgi:uncharacterized protein|nr:TIGR00268 family protein [Methanocalculaceae archaeon]
MIVHKVNSRSARIPEKLRAVLQENSPILIALSGGQDSLVLLAAAKAFRVPAAAATIVSEFTASEETERAARFCREMEISWSPIEHRLLDDAAIRSNPVNRCYLCKRQIMRSLVALAQELGSTVCDGTHADDSPTERPGYAVLRELGICSPFAVAGMGKADILSLAKQLGIPKIPPSSCLATRIPFGVMLMKENLKKIAGAETFLRTRGIAGILRVRLVADETVVEVEEWEMQKAAGLLSELEGLGYSNVCVAEYAVGGVERWKQIQQ